MLKKERKNLYKTRDQKRVYVRNKAGKIVRYANYQKFLESAMYSAFYGNSFQHGSYLDTWNYPSFQNEYCKVEYIVQDGYFACYNEKELRKDIEQCKRKSVRRATWYTWYVLHLYRYHRILFRYDPIPGIHHRRKRVRNCYRHPKTTSEIRANIAFLTDIRYEEYRKLRIKKTRSHHQLPTAWDDFWRGDDKIRSWKRTKKSRQWM
jgi:hypothetical protein